MSDAQILDERDLRTTTSEAERQQLGGSLSLAELLARHRRRPGVAKLRRINPEQRLTRSELDGHEYHRSKRAEDTARDQDLLAKGWPTIRIVGEHLTAPGLATRIERLLTR